MKVKPKPAAVLATINRFPGEASHQSIVAAMMPVWLGRDLASKIGAVDPVENEKNRQVLIEHYRL